MATVSEAAAPADSEERTPESGWARYEAFFGLDEIAKTPELRWLWVAMLGVFVVAFHKWAMAADITRQTYESIAYACPPYFPGCGELYVFESLPRGYTLSALYAVLFGCGVVAMVGLARGRLAVAHLATLPLWLWSVVYLGLLSPDARGNYDYYHITLTAILLFLPHKLVFGRVIFVLFYFMAATVKFHEGWILGTYFTSLTSGLPFIPDSLVPLATNGLALWEALGCWLLLARSRRVRVFALVGFTLFHLYSILLVLYQYPITCIPPLLILFGTYDGELVLPFDRRAIAGWSSVVGLVLLQVGSELIPGDRKLTLEGNDIGLFMFEANHQCVSTEAVHARGAEVPQRRRRESIIARDRCDPYLIYFRLHELCRRERARIERIEWQFDHSINGGPFYRIVDVEDVCELEYDWPAHNAWIRTPSEGAEAVGRPVENIYR